ncbi:hypothetical protein [Frigidibacter sp. SD6-1]|uniref:hypothetical protein n=1 Tax=Frigidibacter sp. SD6-1 TaxID=3032581 RepID=UPI0024E009AB|nr:hypothetical protein [Frigidibacter sp. SD6-1]
MMRAQLMPFVGSALLLATTFAAAIAFAAQLKATKERQEPDVEQQVVPKASAAASPYQPTMRSDAYFNAIFERPLFSPTRRPDKPAANPQEIPETTEASPPEAPELGPDFRLLGTATFGDARTALLAAADGMSTWVGDGQSMEGWTVKEIGNDWVLLGRDAERLRLEIYPK